MKLASELTINAPADQVWKVVAHDFAQIGEWASGVTRSRVNVDAEPLPDAHVGGRICTVPGIGEITETFTAYDERGRTFTYEATGMPFFVRRALNSWNVRALNDNTTQVTFQAEMKLLPVIGTVMGIPMKRQLVRVLDSATEELKHYVETGEIHPRKQRRQARLSGNPIPG